MNCRRESIGLMSLLGGAAMGAVAMYLLDPQQGQRRREALGETAGEAYRGTSEALGHAWESVSERAQRLGQGIGASAAAAGESISDTARDVGRSNTVRGAGRSLNNAGGYLGELGTDLWERARGLGHRFASGAGDVGERVSARSRDTAASVGSWLGREKEEEEHHTVAYALGAVATMALGAGAMYFLDPDQGRRRRALAGDKVTKIVNETGRAFNNAGKMCQDMMNRTRGTAIELQRTVMPEGPVTAEQLLQRVRSQMGHVVSNAAAIQVMTDAEGHVELTGQVLASELDKLLSTVRGVPGVNRMTNRLEVKDRADQISASSGQGSAIPQM